MATMQEVPKTRQSVYQLEGSLLEACSCGILCPCWVGEDPDNGDCLSVNAYHFTSGSIQGIDVSGLNFISVNIIPGNVLTPKSWRVVLFVDGRASPEQKQAISTLIRASSGVRLPTSRGWWMRCSRLRRARSPTKWSMAAAYCALATCWRPRWPRIQAAVAS